MYLPPVKELNDVPEELLRELFDRMGSEFVDAANSYLKYQDSADYEKEIPNEIPLDYENLDGLNLNPSIRDQEYLRHSTLWSHQRLNDKEYERHRIQPGGFRGTKDEKTENTLPAYCTPPNPCPVGYTSANNCITNFENTAAFSRDFQSAQDCMCDTEHMLHCPGSAESSNQIPNVHMPRSEFEQIVEQLQEDNPFFRGEKLPVAAKKGIGVVYY